MKTIIISCFLIFLTFLEWPAQNNPIRLGIVGLSHDHVHWIFNEAKNQKFVISGIYETNPELVSRYQKQYNLPASMFYDDLETLLAPGTNGICIFSSIAEHWPIVKKAITSGIHCMVEKPMALSYKQALAMQKLANKHQVMMLTNYETSWYPALHRAKELIKEGFVGEVRKIVVHMGHQGPQEIGCSKEFLAWLTDPELNGAGALTDFGCYGTNIVSWLFPDQQALSVLALTQQIKPQIYPKVDDEATILIEYPSFQVIIQASWNWPFNRKDVVIYGTKGTIRFDRRPEITYQLVGEKTEKSLSVNPIPEFADDPFAYFCHAIETKRQNAGDPSSITINVQAMQLLDAAIQSAKSGRKKILHKSK